MSVRGPVVEFEKVKVTKETDKALLCVIEGKEVWMPKSQIHEDSKVFKEGDEGTLTVSEWIATEKGLV